MMLPLAIISFVLFANLVAADISEGDGASYDDLKQLNVSCHPQDTCADKEPDVDPGIIYPSTCSCHPACSLLDTCCIDSPHRGESSANHKCGTVDFPETYTRSFGYYMVQSCPENSSWKHMCEGDLGKDGDVLKFAPVTSLDTNTTYKNYYCFRCYETTENFLYWDLKLLSGSDDPVPQTDDFKLKYNDVNNTWSATSVDEDISITVSLKFLIPNGIYFPVISCFPKMVSECPGSWKDDIIRSKCRSYVAILYKGIYGPVYRNAHCALCNSQPLHDLSCTDVSKYLYVHTYSFSFARLIDVNGDPGSKEAKCADGEKRDPYARRCRKLSCVVPGYVIKGDKCVAP